MRGKDIKSRNLQEDYRQKDDVKFRHLPPSYELIEHYRSRLKKIDADYESLSKIVKDCQAICDSSSKLQKELLVRDHEVSQLQQALSDLQVYVFQERQQVLNLYAENDRLKIKTAELLRRNEVLQSISGVSEEELTLFVKKTGSSIEVPRRNVKQRSNRTKAFEDAESSDDVALLQLRVQALEAQLTEQSSLHEDEISALRQDRELQRAERVAECQKQEQISQELGTQLESARNHICKLTSELVQAKQQHIDIEAAWLSEREMLFKNVKEESGHRHPRKKVVLPGGGTKECGVVAALREQLAERERLLATYQEQCLAMEAEITRLHELTENNKTRFKDKVQKMANQVTYLRNKYDELDRRRLLEAEGFRSDIRLMRTRLLNLERGISKVASSREKTCTRTCTSGTSEKTSTASSNICLTAAMDTMQRARQLEVELRRIQGKVISLESELQVENDNA